MAASLTAAGFTIETLEEIEARWRANTKALFGATAATTGSSLMAKLIALGAAAESDLQELMLAVYQAQYPSTATGVALQNVAAIGGLVPKAATYGVGVVEITAAAPGTVPLGSVVLVAATGTRWATQAAAVFAAPGVQAVAVVAIDSGELEAPIGTLTAWEDGTLSANFTVTNAAAATTGSAAENDTELRARYFASYQLPGSSPVGGVRAQLLAVAGVTAAKVYENATHLFAPALDNAPPHSLVAVVTGGQDNAVAQALFDSKAAGIRSWGGSGPTTGNATDTDGALHAIDFMRPVPIVLTAVLTFTAAAGAGDSATVAAAVLAYVNGLATGADVLDLIFKAKALYALDILPDGLGLAVSYTANGGAPYTGSTVVAFNEIATIAAIDISVLGL